MADEQGFIAVYPSGTGVPRTWHVDRGAGLARDVRFHSELIDKLEAAYNIDPTGIAHVSSSKEKSSTSPMTPPAARITQPRRDP